jgi:hypothetical protein
VFKTQKTTTSLRTAKYACNLQRVFSIANALEQRVSKGVALFFIRFNPHCFQKGRENFDPPLGESRKVFASFDLVSFPGRHQMQERGQPDFMQRRCNI